MGGDGVDVRVCGARTTAGWCTCTARVHVRVCARMPVRTTFLLLLSERDLSQLVLCYLCC